MSRRSPQRGFTLIELLLALSLAVLVVGILATAMHLVAEDWERAGNRLDEKLDAALGLLQIERALQGAFPHLYREREENRVYIYFDGKDDRLSWVSTVSPGRQPGLTAWLLQRGKDGKGLEVAYAPAFAENPEKALKKAEKLSLFEDYKVSFEYLKIDTTRAENDMARSEWRDDWAGEKRRGLPQAVRLTLEKSADPRASLELVALILANEHTNLPPVPTP